MKQPDARISDAEWTVMEVLWAKGPQTTAQVCAALAGTGWSRNTVATFLTRLEQKGYLESLPGSPRQYGPLVQRQDCLSRENRSFLQRMYHGSVGLLLASFMKENTLSPQDAQELRQLLDEAQRRQQEETP